MVSAFKTSGSACTRPRARRIIEFRDTGPAGGHVSSRHVHRYFLELEIIIRPRHARVVLFIFASPIYSLILRIADLPLSLSANIRRVGNKGGYLIVLIAITLERIFANDPVCRIW